MSNEAPSPTEKSLEYFFSYFLDFAKDSEGLSELMVNPDGWIYIEKDGKVIDLGIKAPAEKTLSFIALLAGYRGFVADRDHPSVPMRLPDSLGGGRVQALIPPVVQGPMFSIRFPPKRRRTLDELVDNGTFTYVKYRDGALRDWQAVELLKGAIAERRTVLFAGATSSGKTTIMNAFYGELIEDERLFVIEDVPELAFKNKNTVYIMTQANYSTRDAVFDCMRLRPDRIVVGEIRDGNTAIELCKCFLTGHPGGTSSIHADSAIGALFRLKALMQEAVQTPDADLIKNSIQHIVFVNRKIYEGSIIRYADEILDTASTDLSFL